MRTLILGSFLLLGTFTTHAQSAQIDVQREWYASVKTVSMSMLDTIDLYTVRDSVDPKKNILQWHYMQGSNFQLYVHNNVPPVSADRIVDQSWQVKYYRPSRESYLYITDADIHNKHDKSTAKYKVQLYRDTYNILYKMRLLRIYE